jgi:hypothetical protein
MYNICILRSALGIHTAPPDPDVGSSTDHGCDEDNERTKSIGDASGDFDKQTKD